MHDVSISGPHRSAHDQPGQRGGDVGHAAELPPGRVLDDRHGEDLRGVHSGDHTQRLQALAHQLPVSQGVESWLTVQYNIVVMNACQCYWFKVLLSFLPLGARK